jgi:Homeodomain-like domain
MAMKEDRLLLERWLKSPTTPQGVVRRCRIVLLALDGFREESIAAAVDVSRATVKLWIARFASFGANALLHDAPGRGRHASLEWAAVREQLKAAGLLDAEGQPVSLRRASAFLGVSTASLWRALKRDEDERADAAHVTRRRPPGS